MNILQPTRYSIPWPLLLVGFFIFIIGCSAVPIGADATKYRLREAQLNLNTVKAALPAAGYSDDDLIRLTRLADSIQHVLDEASKLDGADALTLVQSAIPILSEAVNNLPNERQRQDGQRLLATLNLADTLIQNQRTLDAEFGTAQ